MWTKGKYHYLTVNPRYLSHVPYAKKGFTIWSVKMVLCITCVPLQPSKPGIPLGPVGP